jgi:L-lysine exporter family protein LysE/ArgO
MSPATPLSPAELGVAFSQGALLMGGLIAAIGAQNALVLRQGAQRQHVLPVVVVCTLSDWLLVALGVFGLGAVIATQPLLLEAFRYGGAAFLLAYGWRAARSAWQGSATGIQLVGGGSSLRATLGTTLALTYLNPHVYLDTVVLVGGVGAQHAGDSRFGFVAGAWAVSAAWFAVLGFGAASVSGWLRRPAVWRAIDASVAVVMWAVAAQLLLKPVQGI